MIFIKNAAKKSGFRLCCAAVAATIVSLTASASDFQSPRTAALGGAGHAGPMLNDAIYLNPSFVSFLPSYSIAANYLFYKGPSSTDGSGDPHGHALNASLQDGRSEYFQAGVGATLMEDRRMINFGASRMAVKRLGFGLGGKFILPKVDNPSAIWDTMFSASYVPFEWLQTAFIIDNIFESDGSRDLALYREYILGTKFNVMGIVLAYFDPHLAPHAPDSFGYELGLEFPFMRDLFVRLGNFRNANVPWLRTYGRGYAAGVGWIAPRLSIDASLHRTLEPVTATTWDFGATVYF